MGILIGSRAIKHWFPEFKREPKDTDYLILNEPKHKNQGCEYLRNPVFLDYGYKNLNIDPEYLNDVLLPDHLYTLKISHVVGWDINWEKHIWDIQWLKEKGCKIDWELFYKLYAFWNGYHEKNKRSDLNMTSEEFFDNAVNFPYDHDELHKLLINHSYFCNQQEPTYKKILIGEVDVCMEKFKNLTENEKFNVVIEEVMVMAMERYNRFYYKKAFSRMLKKFIISHAKLEEAVWIVENHKKLMTNIPFDFIDYLNKQIKEYELPKIK